MDKKSFETVLDEIRKVTRPLRVWRPSLLAGAQGALPESLHPERELQVRVSQQRGESPAQEARQLWLLVSAG